MSEVEIINAGRSSKLANIHLTITVQNKNKATHNESKLLVNYFSPKETRSENKFLRAYKHDNDEIKKSP